MERKGRGKEEGERNTRKDGRGQKRKEGRQEREGGKEERGVRMIEEEVVKKR